MQTVGRLLLDASLPEDLRGKYTVFDKKELSAALGEVARNHSEKYRQVSHDLADLGWRAAQETGGYSVGLSHLTKSKYARALDSQIQSQVDKLLNDDSLSDSQREKQIIKLVGGRLKEQQDKVFDESLAENNPLAYQVLSGSRGNRMNLSTLRGSDLLYSDSSDRPIPVPVLHSYSEGLSPAEYFAGAYGAPRGVIDTKLGVARSGYLSKLLSQSAHRLLVEGLDAPERPDASLRGMPADTDDPDNEGALLARDTGPYKKNTVLTPALLRSLKANGHAHILVRSPIAGSTPGGGVWSRDVGVRERGNLPGSGEQVGLAAAQAVGEKLAQSSLSSKHAGGVAGESGITGFDHIERLVSVPKTFAGSATHADVDGRVSRVEEAPAGGHNVVIEGKKHFVPQDLPVTVHPGDAVEAGDILSDGQPDPAKIVEHKGIGEGRRYFTHLFRDTLKSAGLPAHRRNVELLSRGLIDHVRLTDEHGDYVAGDLVPYHVIEREYEPRKDARKLTPAASVGQYLESPVLHYSIGTRVRPSVKKELEDFGVKEVHVHHEPPPFEPEMVRGAANLASDEDWMTRMFGSGLKKSLLSSAARGGVSDETGSSFVPSLVRGTDFGHQKLVHTPEPGWPVKQSADAVSGVPGASDPLQFGKGLAPKSPSLSNTPAKGVQQAAASPKLPSAQMPMAAKAQMPATLPKAPNSQVPPAAVNSSTVQQPDYGRPQPDYGRFYVPLPRHGWYRQPPPTGPTHGAAGTIDRFKEWIGLGQTGPGGGPTTEPPVTEEDAQRKQQSTWEKTHPPGPTYKFSPLGPPGPRGGIQTSPPTNPKSGPPPVNGQYPKPPAPAQPTPPPAAPTGPQLPYESPYAGGYRPSQNMLGNPLVMAAIMNAKNLGPLGPMALLGGIDANAVSTLLAGPGNHPQPSAAGPATPSAAGPATPAAATPGVTSATPSVATALPAQKSLPVTNPGPPAPVQPGKSAPSAQPPLLPAVSQPHMLAPAQPVSPTPGGGWWQTAKDFAKDVVGGSVPNIVKPLVNYASGMATTKAGPMTITSFNPAATWLGRTSPGLSSAAARFATPVAKYMATTGGKQWLGLRGGFAAQTVWDTAKGAINAFRAGHGNPIKGYGITSGQMMRPMDYESAEHNMDPITSGIALGRNMHNFNPQEDFDSKFRNLPAAQQLTQQARAANPNMKSFQYRVDPSGHTTLVDTVTHVPFRNMQDLNHMADTALKQQILQRLQVEMPGMYSAVTGG